MLLRTKFTKLEQVRYISHLELINTFRRAFRRAEIPVAYSKGFNPHQQLSLGQPLPVGMTGRGEYFDLKLKEDVDIDKFIKKVNIFLPQGIKILDAKEVPEKVKSLMAVINRAVYLIKFNFNKNGISEYLMVRNFLREKEINVIRKRKGKEKEINIRPLIDNIEVVKENYWRFVVCAGSMNNLRPMEIIKGVTSYFSGTEEVPLINVEKEGSYVMIEGEMCQPYEIKVVRS